MIHIAIAEDDEACSRQLREYVCRYGQERGVEMEVTVFSDGLALVDEYRPVWDILLLDIEMPRMDGMTAAQKLRALDADVILIFITNMAKYAIKGYEVGALDFVLKPVSYFAFSLKLDKALSSLESRKQQYLMLPTEDGLIRLSTGEIAYIEVINHRLVFHAEHGIYTTPGTLSEMERQLSGSSFSRCNKGYLVNLRHITLVRAGSVVVGGDELLISRRRKEEFLTAVANYYGGGGK